MPHPRSLRSVAGLVAVVAIVLAGSGAAAPRGAEAAETTLPAWTGGVNVYRAGVFTTQKSWLWCTAAGVQIARNIVDHKSDHTTSGQRRYFDWMRDRNRYDLPLSAGVDPAGWTAGLRHFVDDRYRLVSSRTFDGALRSAVTRLRLTGLPVALAVSHGNHGWILTGFRATADPAKTSSFRVTSVRVTGPLYGLQSKNGYDMAPNTKLTTAQLRHYFTPWKYAPRKMVWDGRYVSIQPVPKKAISAASTAKTASAPTADPSPTLAPSPSPTARATSIATASGTEVAVVLASATPAVADPALTTTPPVTASAAIDGAPIGGLAIVCLGLIGMLAVILRGRFRASPRAGPPPS